MEPLGAAEQDSLADFLAGIFGVSRKHAFVRPEFLRWKYFQPRPDWDGPRSWVLRQEGRIASHAGVWPVRLRLSGRTIQTAHIIDWAATPDAPGAGALIYREALRRAGMLLGIGGSEQARKIVRKLGARQIGTLRNYVRVVRPWKQFRTRPPGGWKAAAKAVRNTLWSRRPLMPAGTWRAAGLASFPQPLPDAGEPAGSGWVRGERTAAQLDYILSCPATCRGFLLECAGEARGHMLLSRMGGQARIAGLRIAAAGPGDWEAAYAVAIREAAADPECAELVAVSSNAWTAAALEANGFAFYNDKPIWVLDPGGCLGETAEVDVQGLESDGFFLHDPAHPYLT